MALDFAGLSEIKFFIFALLFNVVHAKDILNDKTLLRCNSPYGYVEQSSGQTFIFMGNLENEIWKDVVGYEGLYSISNLGRIKSYDRIVPTKVNNVTERVCKGKELNKCISKQGYEYVRLCKNGKGRNFQFHQLLAKSFIPNPLNKPHINHKNFIRNDNRLENLEWVTISENNKHSRINKDRISKSIHQYNKDKILFIIDNNKNDCLFTNENTSIKDRAYPSLDRNVESYSDEIWQDIIGYEKLYQVSNYGRIRGIRRYARTRWFGGDIIKQHEINDGYLRVYLCKNGNAKSILVHRIVATAFVYNELNKSVVNHIDGNPSNNLPSNLEWVTQRENVIHAYKIGRRKGGVWCFNSKASESDIKSIREISLKFNVSGKYLHDNYFPHIPSSSINRIIQQVSYKS